MINCNLLYLHKILFNVYIVHTHEYTSEPNLWGRALSPEIFALNRMVKNSLTKKNKPQ